MNVLISIMREDLLKGEFVDNMNLLQNFDLNIDDIYVKINAMRKEKEKKKFQPKKIFEFLNPFKKSETNVNIPRTSQDAANQYESFIKILDGVMAIDDKVGPTTTSTEVLIQEPKEDAESNSESKSLGSLNYTSDEESFGESTGNLIKNKIDFRSLEAIHYDTRNPSRMGNHKNLSESKQLLATSVCELNDLTPPKTIKYLTKASAKMSELDKLKYSPRSLHDLQQLQLQPQLKKKELITNSKNFQSIDLRNELEKFEKELI